MKLVGEEHMKANLGTLYLYYYMYSMLDVYLRMYVCMYVCMHVCIPIYMQSLTIKYG